MAYLMGSFLISSTLLYSSCQPDIGTYYLTWLWLYMRITSFIIRLFSSLQFDADKPGLLLGLDEENSPL